MGSGSEFYVYCALPVILHNISCANKEEVLASLASNYGLDWTSP